MLVPNAFVRTDKFHMTLMSCDFHRKNSGNCVTHILESMFKLHININIITYQYCFSFDDLHCKTIPRLSKFTKQVLMLVVLMKTPPGRTVTHGVMSQ